MELNLARLNEIALKDFDDVPEGEANVSKEGPVEGHTSANTGTQRLQRQADSNREAEERTARIYKEYQENIRIAGGIRADILSGIRQGESAYVLFLKAVKAISHMTSDTRYYDQVETEVKAIYGAGLLEPLPLKLELQEVQERLRRLEEAMQREGEPQDGKRLIETAIKAHREREQHLRSLL